MKNSFCSALVSVLSVFTVGTSVLSAIGVIPGPWFIWCLVGTGCVVCSSLCDRYSHSCRKAFRPNPVNIAQRIEAPDIGIAPQLPVVQQYASLPIPVAQQYSILPPPLAVQQSAGVPRFAENSPRRAMFDNSRNTIIEASAPTASPLRQSPAISQSPNLFPPIARPTSADYNYNVEATLKGALYGCTDSLVKYPREAGQLIRNVSVPEVLGGSAIMAIIKSAFEGSSISDKRTNALAQDLERINAFANMSDKELRLKGEYSNVEISHMVETATLKAVLEEVRAKSVEGSESCASFSESEPSEGERVPAALAALASSKGDDNQIARP